MALLSMEIRSDLVTLVVDLVQCMMVTLHPRLSMASNSVGRMQALCSRYMCLLFADLRMLPHPYRFSIQPLTILGVTGPFSILAENIYSLCLDTFHVSQCNPVHELCQILILSVDPLFIFHGMVLDSLCLDALFTSHI